MTRSAKAYFTESINLFKRYYKVLGSSYMTMGIQGLVFFFLTPFFLKHLGEDQYGVWLLLANVIAYFAISNFGLNTSFMVRLPGVINDDDSKLRLVNTTFFALLFLCGVFVIVFAILAFNLGDFFNVPPEMISVSQKAFLFLFFAFVCNVFYGFFDSVLYMTDRIVLKNVIEALKILITNVLLFLILFVFDGLLAMSIVQFVVYFLFMVILFRYAKNILRIDIDRKYFDGQLLRNLVSPSLHYFLITVSTQIVYYSDTILVSAMAGIGYVAMYAIMYRVTDVFVRIFFKIADIKLPRITQLWHEKNISGLVKLHNKLLLLTLAACVPVFIVLFFFGADLIGLWVGQKYFIDQKIMQVLALSMVVNTCIHVTAVFIMAMGLHHRVAYMSIVEAVLNILLSIAFFRLWGLIGIPLGTLVAGVSTTAWFILYHFYRGAKPVT